MSIKKLSVLALFIALSIVGSFIKIPAIVGSVALDLFPALIAAAYLGRSSGAIVACFGHLISALIAGFPLGPVHIIVAIEMAIIVLVFAYIYNKGKRILAGIFVVISNAIFAPLPMLILFSVAFYITLIPSLFIGALLNTVVAYLLIPRLQHILNELSVHA